MADTGEEKSGEEKGKDLSKSKLLKVPIRVRSQDGEYDEEFMDYILEVDKDRIYVKTEDPFPQGTVVHLGLDLPGVKRTVHFKGEVVRINPHKPESENGLDPGMGIIFERVSYDSRKLINDYLDRISSDERSGEYSLFLSWVQRISRPMGTRERERIKKDLLKALYSSKEEPVAESKRKKTAGELELIAKVPLFEEFDDMELDQVSRIMLREEVEAGKAIFEEGDVGDRMYIILRGSVDIVKSSEKGPGQVLVTLKPGDYFGEMSLIDDSPRSASAVAAEDSLIFSIKKKDLSILLDREPAIAAKVYKFFVHTLNERLRQTNEKIKQFVSMATEMSQA
ncbi:MAG: cyclic nucleotide-binding domain-containing protein [bacterium]